MRTAERLNRMHRDASARIRAGSHDEFLVGFLTASTMLELANLFHGDLDVAAYAQACVDVVTQLAPIDQCALWIVPADLPSVVASVGAGIPAGGQADGVDVGEFATDEVSGQVLASEMPTQLRTAGFIDLAADQIGSGMDKVLELERLRRRAAVANAFATIAALDARWGADALAELVESLALVPGAIGASLTATAPRFGGALAVQAGRLGTESVARAGDIDRRLELSAAVCFEATPSEAQRVQVEEIFAALFGNLARIEENLRLASEADTDQLTGVGNRRRISKALVAARETADRNRQHFAVLIVDLDHFKQINDRLGHDVGDQVLITVARMLERNVRSFDTVGRWGGEEFLLICAGCDGQHAEIIAQRILTECGPACAPLLPPDMWQTASVGFAVYPDISRAPEALIGAADNALYAAKRNGRNRFDRAS